VSIQGIKATLLLDEATVLDDGFDNYDEWLLAVRRSEVPCFGKIHWSLLNDHDIYPFEEEHSSCKSPGYQTTFVNAIMPRGKNKDWGQYFDLIFLGV
jgi:hypothetical protein